MKCFCCTRVEHRLEEIKGQGTLKGDHLLKAKIGVCLGVAETIVG